MEYYYPFKLELHYTQPNGKSWTTVSRRASSIKDCQDDIYQNCGEEVAKNTDGQRWIILEGPPELWL